MITVNAFSLLAEFFFCFSPTHINVVVETDDVRVSNVGRRQGGHVELLVDKLIPTARSNLGELQLRQLSFLGLDDFAARQVLNRLEQHDLCVANGDFAEVLNVAVDDDAFARNIS